MPSHAGSAGVERLIETRDVAVVVVAAPVREDRVVLDVVHVPIGDQVRPYRRREDRSHKERRAGDHEGSPCAGTRKTSNRWTLHLSLLLTLREYPSGGSRTRDI